MHPKIFQFGDFYLPTYGLLVTTGVILALFLSLRLAKAEGFSKEQREQLSNLVVSTIIGGILGSKLLLVIVDLPYYVSHPYELIYLVRAGGVFYGGLIGGIATAAILLRRYKFSFPVIGDILAPHIALGHAIGRLGCFSAGCCYGKHCDLPFGVTFDSGFAHSVVGVPLHDPLYPTQLISACLLLLIYLTTRYFVFRKRTWTGQVFWSYVTLYSISRFAVEFIRGDLDRGFVVDWLSTSQFISLMLFTVSIGVHLWHWRRRASS